MSLLFSPILCLLDLCRTIFLMFLLFFFLSWNVVFLFFSIIISLMLQKFWMDWIWWIPFSFFYPFFLFICYMGCYTYLVPSFPSPPPLKIWYLVLNEFLFHWSYGLWFKAKLLLRSIYCIYIFPLILFYYEDVSTDVGAMQNQNPILLQFINVIYLQDWTHFLDVECRIMFAQKSSVMESPTIIYKHKTNPMEELQYIGFYKWSFL